MSEIKNLLMSKISTHVKAGLGKSIQAGNAWDIWEGLAKTIIELIADDWEKTREKYAEQKQVFYFSAEFLQGRSMLNNLMNLEIYQEAKEALQEMGIDLTDVLESETDASLGNGGLGRLAACFLDSAATLNYPVTGYGILYRYGLFKQQFDNGFQVEKPDSWMESGYAFTLPNKEEKVRVHFSDFDVWAIPYDMPIVGYGTKNVNVLRLWKTDPLEEFNFALFNEQKFDDSVGLRNRANDICRVLYPNDTTKNGKILRVRQQYFFVSASLQDIVRKHVRVHGKDLSNFYQYNKIQLNDTHPVIGIPELMRILLDEYSFSWDTAWEIVKNTFAYTNHTIMSEALEKWDIDIFQFLFPRVFEIIQKIDEQFRSEMHSIGKSDDEIQQLAPLGDGKVRMAWLAIYGSFSVNGVAALHTEILKTDTLREWYKIYPERFSNKTNGVTPRRWIRNCNYKLSELLTELLGSDAWVTDLEQLSDLEKYENDDTVMKRLIDIKYHNKEKLAKYCMETQGIELNPNSLFDMQIKRLHEYKRQLLNILYVLNLYDRIKENPALKFPPVTVFFGAKAAPGYFRAKAIIKFINEAAKMINNDAEIGDRLKIVFIENYNVSNAEKMFPAADLSEQISTAGLEASGTGNMKFMMNGAKTIGTLDGANIEIAEALNQKYIYIFGCLADDRAATMEFYNSMWQYENVPGLKKVLDRLIDGSFQDDHTGLLQDIFNGLLHSGGWEKADYYYVLGDFESYREARDKAYLDYQDQMEWARSSWRNICRSGRFSADRTIKEYASDIWKIDPAKIGE